MHTAGIVIRECVDKSLKTMEITNRQAQKVVAVSYRICGRFIRDSNCKVLTGKILVFWIGGRLREVVGHGGSTVFNEMQMSINREQISATKVLRSAATSFRPGQAETGRGGGGGRGSGHQLTRFFSSIRCQCTVEPRYRRAKGLQKSSIIQC